VAKDQDEVKYIAKSLRELFLIVQSFEKCVHYLVVTDDLLREFLAEVVDRLDRIEEDIPGKEELHQITRELEQQRIRDHIRSLQTTITQQYANKDRLTEEAAKYGANVPLEITNHIISINVEIDKLKSELEHFRELLE